MLSHRRSIVLRFAFVPAAWLGLAGLCAGQQPWAPSPPAAEAQNAHTDHDAQPETPTTEPPGIEYPSLHISGFGNVDLAHLSDPSQGPRRFSEGQFVLHFVSALSPRASFFGEVSLTPRPDAGTGTPPASGFNAEVERLIIRFDQSDLLKVSFGRYHTPINWWNTAFHHGAWLQTTILRPEMIQFGGKFLPIHFVGALAEGVFPAGGWNLNYQAGYGNGRGNVISRAGDAGDNNAEPAWVGNVFVKPDRAFGLQVGGSLYLDRISQPGQPQFNERIVAGHIAWQHEDPEFIAEIANVWHEQIGTSAAASSLAYYLQAAYRLPSIARLWKPYYRYEHIGINSADPVFVGVPNLDGSTLGVRYDISTYVALKGEFRTWTRPPATPRTNGGFFQVAFTF